MSIGIIKHFNKDKGYGFISVEGKKDIFFHVSGCNGTDFRKFDKVSFKESTNRHGDIALEVTLVESAADNDDIYNSAHC